MHPSAYLRALLTPSSVAVVGASGKAGSMGRILFENLVDGGFAGPIHAVNPYHRRVLARRSYASLTAIGKPVDLVLVATPTAAVDSGHRGCRACGGEGRGHPVGRRQRTPPRQNAGAPRSRRSRPHGVFVCWDPTRSASCGPAFDSTRRWAAPLRNQAGWPSSLSPAPCARRCSISLRRSASDFRPSSSSGARST
jgi:hypothetical protein